MKFKDAIRDALAESMRADSSVFVMGPGVPDPKGIFGSTLGLAEEFGSRRVFDVPLAEHSLAGIAIGAAMQGMRPVLVSQRIDFLLLAIDQIANHASKWKHMFNGAQKVPILIRAIVGRGWGQGAQHAQSLHATFAHFPGLRVVAPASAYDVKGMLIAALEGDDPVVMIEHRWLFEEEGPVPAGLYRVPLDKAAVVGEGSDVTLVATSQMVLEAKKAADALRAVGISAELIDLRSLNPIDMPAIQSSLSRTGRLVVADADWRNAGIAGEILARAAESAFALLKAPPARVVWPDLPSPTSVSMEKEYFPGALEIYMAALKTMGREVAPAEIDESARPFLGPF